MSTNSSLQQAKKEPPPNAADAAGSGKGGKGRDAGKGEAKLPKHRLDIPRREGSLDGPGALHPTPAYSRLQGDSSAGPDEGVGCIPGVVNSTRRQVDPSVLLRSSN